MSARRQPLALELVHELLTPRADAPRVAALFVLHGRGATSGDLLPLAHELVRAKVLVVAPQAPLELRGPFGTGYAWYHLHEVGSPDEASFDASLSALARFVDRAVAGYRADPSKVFVLGFSQGAVMAFALAARLPGRFAGLVALSGYLDPRVAGAAEATGFEELPVFIGHGSVDELIGVSHGRAARDTLRARGAAVTYREYPAPHTIAAQEVTDLRSWFAERLGSPPPP